MHNSKINKRSPRLLNLQLVKSVIFQNHSPTVFCQPFLEKWKVPFKLAFYLHSELFDFEDVKNFFSLERLAQTLSPRVTDSDYAFSILKKCQLITVNELFKTYLDYWKEYSTDLELVQELTEDSESIMYWEVGKKSGFNKILKFNTTGRLSLYQTHWAYLNIIRDAKNRNTEIEIIFDALKPWLDKEMYFAIEEKKDTTRENVEFEEELEKAGLDLTQLDDSLDIVSR